jgi:hypothetical protein
MRFYAGSLTRRGVALFGLAGRKRARALVARADVETIEHAEVGIAYDLQAPQQGQSQRTADAAHNFQRELTPVQRLDTNFNAGFFFAGFH